MIGSWWVLAVPAVPALTLIAGYLLMGSETDYEGWSGFDWAAVVAFIAAPIIVLLALAVGLNRLLSCASQRHPLSHAGAEGAGPDSRQ